MTSLWNFIIVGTLSVIEKKQKNGLAWSLCYILPLIEISSDLSFRQTHELYCSKLPFLLLVMNVSFMENRTLKPTALCSYKNLKFFFKHRTSRVLFPHSVQAWEMKAPEEQPAFRWLTANVCGLKMEQATFRCWLFCWLPSLRIGVVGGSSTFPLHSCSGDAIGVYTAVKV